MEITTEIKKAVVYQYYGKDYVYKNEFGTYSDMVGGFHTNTHIQYDSFKLKLKPLSVISSHHAIEVGKIIGYEIKDTCPEFVVREKGKTFCDILLTDKGFSYHPVESLLVYQFLISKGYDLPHYLLGGKTLQEVGLAIYTK